MYCAVNSVVDQISVNAVYWENFYFNFFNQAIIKKLIILISVIRKGDVEHVDTYKFTANLSYSSLE